MAIFQSGSVVFYHPCDNSTEFTQNYSWTRDNIDFADSILTSGIKPTQDMDYNDFRASVSSGNYPTLSGATSITICFWSSGFFDPLFNYHQVEVGTDPDSFTPDSNLNNGMYIDTQPVSIFGLGAAGTGPTSPVAPTTSGWHFTVLDMEQEGDLWRFRASFDGSGFQNLGVAGSGSSFGSDAAVKIKIFDLDSPNKLIIDEAVLWKNRLRFTSQELSNLYQLYNTHSLTMDQYDSVYTNSIYKNLNLFISSLNVISDDITLYIPGQVETDRINLFITGPILITDNLNLFLENKQVIDNIDLYIPGQIESDRIDLFTHGKQVISDNLNLTLINRYFNDKIDLFIHGIQTGSWNLFAKVEDTTTTRELTLFINGVPSGSPQPIFYIADGLNLFINNIEQTESVINDWSIFVRTESGTVFSENQTFNLFVKVGHTESSFISLYIQGHTSGENPRGISIDNNLEFFIEGSGELFNQGFIPFNNAFDIFVRVQSGIVDNIDLFISGFIFPSQTLDLYTFGISGLIDDNLNLYINGSETQIAELLNLSIFGILDTINENLDLFIFTDIGIETKDFSLYIHGF